LYLSINFHYPKWQLQKTSNGLKKRNRGKDASHMSKSSLADNLFTIF
jgi:hypothetical protein